jgi:hypothetical protein
MSYLLTGLLTLDGEIAAMSKCNFLRKRLWVDGRVQGALTCRVVVYWFLWPVSIASLLLLSSVGCAALGTSDQLRDMWYFLRLAGLVSLVLMPVIVFDLLRLTNRFAGPMFRLRRVMRDLAAATNVEQIRFRDGDFWPEVAGDFNVIAALLRKAQPLAADLQPAAEDEAEMAAAIGAGRP